MTYLVLAIGWWSVLLFSKNEELYQAELQYYECLSSDAPTEEALEALHVKRERQKWMILGESLFLTLSVLAGIYLISRAYWRESAAARQQQNFLLSITHELKSPLAAIRLSLETMQRKALPENVQKQLVDSALKEDRRLEELVDKLLLAARVEGAPSLTLQPVALAPVIEKVTGHLRIQWPDRRVQVDMLPVRILVTADAGGLQSVLNNLLENAVKYTEPGEGILVEVRGSGDYATIKVMDRGPGIPDAEKSAVFQKFYRTGSEHTRKTKGTGLGLYIAWKLVEAMDGSIWVSDRPGGGAVFHVKIPQLPSNAPEQNDAQPITD